MPRTPPSASEVKRRAKERIDAQLHRMRIERAWDNLSDEQRAEIDRQVTENAPKALKAIAQRDTTFRKFQLNYLSQLAHLDYERSKIGKRKEFGNLIWVFRTLGIHASYNVDPPAWAMEALTGISKQIFEIGRAHV